MNQFNKDIIAALSSDKDITLNEVLRRQIEVAERCEGCITQHTAACIKAGASCEEFAEAISVAIMMAGGPATVYGGKALACFDQLSK